MSVKIFSCLPQGLEGKLIEVEADILQGLSAFDIVGLGDTAVQEAKQRVRSAIKNSGASYPQQKKIINLAPADLKKHGPQFDLPIAVSLLAASGQIDPSKLSRTLIMGELALNGAVRAIRGVLTMALFARQNGWQKIIIPAENYEEAALIKNLEIIPIQSLKDLIDWLRHPAPKNLNSFLKPKNGTKSLPGQQSERERTPFQKELKFQNGSFQLDFADIKGQESAKRALTIAAAGGHHILLTGPPGIGKTMLAKALPSILPPLTEEEMFEVIQIYSCAGLLSNNDNHSTSAINPHRPFRQVHSTASLIALIGGSTALKPGEISLAHRGILFLDEIAEFPRSLLEALRQPLEAHEIHLGRGSGQVRYPANFMLVAGMNPCPCGYYGDPQKECQCRPAQILNYQKKLSGPLLDRLDLIVQLPRQSIFTYQENNTQTSNQIRAEIIQARQLQRLRFKNQSSLINSEMPPALLKIHCALNPTTQDFLTQAAEKFSFSGRNYHQLLKTARTIADLNAHDQIQLEDLSEALQYRHRST